MEVDLSPGDTVRWGPISPPKKDTAPPLFDHVYCGQIARWIKMPLGMEVGLGPSNGNGPGSVRVGPSSPKKGHSPQFWPMSVVAKRSPISATAKHLLHSTRQKVPILYNGTPLPPQNCHFPWGDLDPHLIHDSLGPLESSTQTISWSVQLFLQGSLLWQTDTARYPVSNNGLHLRT